MMRFVIALGVALMIVIMAWPYLRRFMPRAEPGQPKPTSKGEMIWLALLITVALSFGISTMLWVFGR